MFTRLISFIFKIYLSRKLGAEILGIYQICFSIFGLFSCICASGIPVTLSRMTAETSAKKEFSIAASIISTCMLTALTMAVGIIAIIYSFPSLTDMLFSDPRCKPIFLIIIPLLITTAVYSIIRSWFWGNKEYAIYSITEFVDEFIKIIICIIFLSTNIYAMAKYSTYGIAIVVSDVIMTIILLIIFFAKGGRFGKPKLFKSICRSSAPMTTTRIAGNLTSTFMSLVIPAILVSKLGFSTAQATAEFGRASGMVMPLIFTPISLVGSLSVILIPEVAAMNAKNNLKSFEKGLSSIIKYTLVIGGFFFLIYSSLGSSLGQMLYADAKAGEYLSFCAILIFPMAINNLVVSILNSLGKELHTFLSHIASCVTLVVTVIFATQKLGILSYFVSLTVFHTFNLIINMVLLSKKFAFEKGMCIDCSLIIIFSLCLSFLTKFSNAFFYNKAGMWSSFFVCAITATIVYFLALILMKVVDISFLKLPKHTKPNKNRKHRTQSDSTI